MPDVISFCQELVRTPSLSGQEADVARAVARQMAALSYGDIYMDEFGDVIGIRHGREPGPTLLLDGHMDTVAAVTPERWQRPPFRARSRAAGCGGWAPPIPKDRWRR